jgi:hypothetical protein
VVLAFGGKGLFHGGRFRFINMEGFWVWGSTIFGRIISEEYKFNSTEYFGSSLNSDNLNSLNIN